MTLRQYPHLSAYLFALVATACSGSGSGSGEDATDGVWKKQFDLGSNGTNSYYTDMQFPSERVGYAVGNNFFVGKTSDGGKTWRKLESGIMRVEGVFTSVHFLDENEGWIAGWGMLLHTVDGGETWSSHMPTDPEVYLPSPQDVYFSDRLHGVMVGMYNRILYTEDGGDVWRKPSFDFDVELNKTDHYRAYLLPDGRGWVGGTGTVFAGTLDGGKTWSHLSNMLTMNSTSNLQFLDAANGFATGGGGLLKTTDGGVTWITTNADMGGTLHAFSTQHLMAGTYKVGASYRESTDGAQSSHAIGGTATLDVRAVTFANPDLGWAMSPLGVIAQFTR